MSVFRKWAGEKDMKENRIGLGMRIVKAGEEMVRTYPHCTL
jgi:hypothetical protein